MSRSQDHFKDLPPPTPFPQEAVLRNLADGLVLRRASEEDVEALAAFHRVALADPPDFEPNDFVADWTRELMDGGHPTMRAQDFLIVEDTRERRIASSLCLLSHRFAYQGIEFPAGQPELVATHPAFRRRGLVRAQFEVIHRWSQERGQRLLLIDGIPNYYRQFGYEMAIESLAVRATCPAHLQGTGLYRWQFPVADTRKPETLRTRRATESDVPFLQELYGCASARQRLVCLRDLEHWRFDISRRRPGSYCRREVHLVEGADGARLAAFATFPLLLNGVLTVSFYEVAKGISWPQVNPAVLQEIRATGEAFAARDGGEPFSSVTFMLGTGHPFYAAARARVPDERRPYAYYARVPDLPGFLLQVAPALEARLAASPLASHTGRIDLSFYRSGLQLHLEDGRLARVEGWQPSTEERGHLAFPGLTFLQLLFGYRSLAELEGSFPDCLASNETATAVVDAMFPKRYSNLWLTG